MNLCPRPDPAIQDQNMISDFHVATVSCLVVIVVTMIAATATVRCVSVANKYWVGIYYNLQVLNHSSGLYFQVIYRVNNSVTGILLGYTFYKQYNNYSNSTDYTN